MPDAVLRQCPKADRILVEIVLRFAQAEFVVLKLASTTLSVEGRKITLKTVSTGPSQSVSLTTMRNLQAYSGSCFSAACDAYVRLGHSHECSLYVS